MSLAQTFTHSQSGSPAKISCDTPFEWLVLCRFIAIVLFSSLRLYEIGPRLLNILWFICTAPLKGQLEKQTSRQNKNLSCFPSKYYYFEEWNNILRECNIFPQFVFFNLSFKGALFICVFFGINYDISFALYCGVDMDTCWLPLKMHHPMFLPNWLRY